MAYTTDPRMGTPQWRAIRAYWQNLKPTQCEATNCLLPNQPITYTTERTPTSLDVGHILDRNTDTRTEWQIIDTRPEHSRCNRSAGASIRKTTTTITNYTNPDW